MMAAWKILRAATNIIAFAVTLAVLLSGSVRTALLATIDRKIASISPPQYAVVGDSLTADCNWRWNLGTLSAINLGTGGTNIREIARQVNQAFALKTKFVSIEAGINDVLLEGASIQRVEQDFKILLQQIPPDRTAIVTLIPYVSDGSLSNKIDAANGIIRSLATARGLAVVDLNPNVASNGIRNPDMTTDGIHLSSNACRVWANKIRENS